ncbi:ATP-dependent DNA helicase RecG [Ahniella affigens]|uniref:ATP-dependent DNA helicase RecG n=1 Tax=Ahniella affigens TaxID=2021234 RepID=A0A2P1PYG4_9GAMM|nr:ATP-dependent DNA helicase RecG [Ahniella affigens]AVP99864.1 ATP-dependent DNA helicase RecG [Ahniella affigens]
MSPGLESTSVSVLKGVGPAVRETLAKLSLVTLADLWFHLPLRFEDRTQLTPIRDLIPGQTAQVEGLVEAVERGFRFRPQLKVAISDDSLGTLVLRFIHFHSAQAASFQAGARFRVYGDVRLGKDCLEMIHPSYTRVLADTPLADALTPVYPLTEGLGQKTIQRLIQEALTRLPPESDFELLPVDLRVRHDLPGLRESLLTVHRPGPDDVADLLAQQHPAQRRLAFDELLAHQISLRQIRKLTQQLPATRIIAGKRRKPLLKALPFQLTGAQTRVLSELDRDLACGKPMMRLVQGDVGSGKTVVAAIAAASAADAGVQTALLAPTELLAEQHYRNVDRWLSPLGIRVVHLSGKIKGKARDKALADIAGDADVVVGTHALIQDQVRFRALSLIVIDEQHRFGVHQRLSLREKGLGALVPHQLVMTATPIPRTLAMSLYADLDVSVIDELPPGRTPVATKVISNSRRDEVIERIRAACAEGRQAYWVCPLIEESEQLEAQAAEATFKLLTESLPDLPIGLLHGRMKSKDKRATMDAFQSGALRLLVATTVIEVGVDVPNASLMIIENAERMGLSQLHQLRGRVGRGRIASSCVLMYQPPLGALARERLNVLRETEDGFKIAERDLQLRGPGELLGTRQTGELAFRIANLSQHAEQLPHVSAAADWMLEHAPEAAERLMRRWIGQQARFADA